MVDLKGQYLAIKDEVDAGIREVINNTSFINGPKVREFSAHLSEYLGGPHVVTCANGTDALQIALMALDLKPGDEVIVPSFTYAASAEVLGLLRLTPVMVDVDADTFNVSLSNIEKGMSEKTKAIIVVHLFGQSCDMEPIMRFAWENSIRVIEDNAQAIGADYKYPDGPSRKTGTVGDIGCTSFFPSKNLGCYGDGGAMITNDPDLAEKLRMIANHGQKQKYHHSIIGCNSRLDTIQAAILDVKLKHLDEYCDARCRAAGYYDQRLSGLSGVTVPARAKSSTHVFHQYTLKIDGGKRNGLKDFLSGKKVPSMIYYPVPLHQQEAFKSITRIAEPLENSTYLASSVLSIPMHTELTQCQQDLVADSIMEFFD